MSRGTYISSWHAAAQAAATEVALLRHAGARSLLLRRPGLRIIYIYIYIYIYVYTYREREIEREREIDR